MRIRWFTFPLVIIVFLASSFVTWFIVSGAYALITPTWVMAAFTVVLAIAMIWNIRVTQGLLRRAETTSVIEIIDRMTDYVNQNTTNLGIDTVTSNLFGRLAAIQKVDKKLSGVLWKALIAWGSETKYEEFKNRYEQTYGKNSTREGK